LRPTSTSTNNGGGGFQGQDDFISFAELEADAAHDAAAAAGGAGMDKGKQRAGAATENKRGKKRPIADVLEEQGKTKLRDVDKATCVNCPPARHWDAARLLRVIWKSSH
jgi:hypothetical protein